MTETPERGYLSLSSTDLYWGVFIPIFGHQWFGRVVRAELVRADGVPDDMIEDLILQRLQEQVSARSLSLSFSPSLSFSLFGV